MEAACSEPHEIEQLATRNKSLKADGQSDLPSELGLTASHTFQMAMAMNIRDRMRRGSCVASTWVAVKELKIIYHTSKTKFLPAIDPYYGNLN